jgi:hypothetical protein
LATLFLVDLGGKGRERESESERLRVRALGVS